MTNLPAHGAVIVFDRVPAGSYASTGEAYRVHHRNPRSDVHVTNVKTGAGTFDRPWAYRDAAWHPAA